MRALKALTAAVLALGAGPVAEPAHFAKGVPAGVPSVAGWERISGELELADPHVSVQYEFYVNPERLAAYEVVRYRITERSSVVASRRYAATEKLQWDRDGRDVRRWECMPAAGRGCDWREMARDTKEYIREVPVLLWLYGQHQRKMAAARRRQAG